MPVADWRNILYDAAVRDHGTRGTDNRNSNKTCKVLRNQKKIITINTTSLSQADCPSCRPTNSVRALKDELSEDTKRIINPLMREFIFKVKRG